MSSKIIEALEIGLAFAQRAESRSELHPSSRDVALIESALAEARAAPAGEWVTVPREPTPEMAYQGAITGLDGRPDELSNGIRSRLSKLAADTYRAMLSAAPPAPAAEPVLWVYQFDGKVVTTNNEGMAKRVAAALGVTTRPLIYGDTAPPPVEASQQQDSGEKADEYVQQLMLGMRTERIALAAEISRLTAERDALKAEAEALRKDAERWQWRKDNPTARLVYGKRRDCEEWRVEGCGDIRWHPTADAAVDAAIAAQGSQRSENRNGGEKP